MTKLLVLGLVDGRPMSGYDIQQMVNRADAERWGGVLPGSIYHALNKLEREGCISLADVTRTGHRQRAVYQITDRGREQLHDLLLQTLRAPATPYPTALYSALSLLDRLPREEARQALREQRTRLEEEAGALARGQAQNAAEREEVPPVSRITIEHMVALIRLQRRFVEQLLEALEEGAAWDSY